MIASLLARLLWGRPARPVVLREVNDPSAPSNQPMDWSLFPMMDTVAFLSVMEWLDTDGTPVPVPRRDREMRRRHSWDFRPGETA